MAIRSLKNNTFSRSLLVGNAGYSPILFSDTFDTGTDVNGRTGYTTIVSASYPISGGYGKVGDINTGVDQTEGWYLTTPFSVNFTAIAKVKTSDPGGSVHSFVLRKDANNLVRLFAYAGTTYPSQYWSSYQIVSGTGSYVQQNNTTMSTNTMYYHYLKIVRNGNTFTFSYSSDGVTYTSRGSTTISGWGATDPLYVRFESENNANSGEFQVDTISVEIL